MAAGDRTNLTRASVLALDQSPQGLSIVCGILQAFGVRTLHRCSTVAEAKSCFSATPLDIAVIDPLFEREDGFALMAWARREALEQNRTIPVIAALGHVSLTNVASARDSGANFILAKPVTPDVLMQRIQWVARENRLFISAAGYVGPDRRFRNDGPPPGQQGRRFDDLPITIGDAQTPNMAQNEIDDLMKPRKVTL